MIIKALLGGLYSVWDIIFYNINSFLYKILFINKIRNKWNSSNQKWKRQYKIEKNKYYRYNYNELNLFSYEEELKIDKRKYIQYYIS